MAKYSGIVIESGKTLTLNKQDSATNITVNPGGCLFFSGGSASGVTIYSDEGLEFGGGCGGYGGTLQNAKIVSGGLCEFKESGFVSGISVFDGVLIMKGDDCVASGTKVYASGIEDVRYGVSYKSVVTGGSQWVCGGTAVDAIISGGEQLVEGIERYNDITGECDEYQGVAVRTQVHSGGFLRLGSDGRADSAIIYYGGKMIMEKDSLASEITVNRGASLELADSTKLSGNITVGGSIQATGHVTMQYCVIGVALNQRQTTDSFVIDNWAYFRDADLAVTVADNQAGGSYKLIQNAKDFSGKIAVKTSRGTKIASLAVGASYNKSGKTYTLTKNNEALYFEVVSGKNQDTEAPEKVLNTTVNVANNYKATLKWDKATDNSGKISKYEIILDGKTYSTSRTGFTTGKLSVGEHSCAVRALDKEKNVGEWSDTVTFAVKDQTAPTSLKCKIAMDGYSALFSLSGKDNVGITKYTIICENKSVSTDSSAAVLDDFSVGRHTAFVTAYDAENNASKALKISFTVKDSTPPELVTGLTAAENDRNYKVNLQWDSGTDNSGKIAGYEIQLDDGKIYKTSKNFLKTSKLSVGKHGYRVRAIDKEKNVGEWSDTVNFTVVDVTSPSKVSVKSKISGNQIQLKWSTPKDNVSVAGYTLRYGMNLENTAALDESAVDFEFDAPSKGNWYYELTAYDEAGNQSKAAIGRATIKNDLLYSGIDLNLNDEKMTSAKTCDFFTELPISRDVAKNGILA